MLEYIINRNGYSDGDVNWSVVGTQYRSYGLLDKHTTTGNYISLGALAIISLLAGHRLRYSLATLAAALLVLFLGGATAAFLTCCILLPAAVLFSAANFNLHQAPWIAIKIIATLVFIMIFAVLVAQLDWGVGILFHSRLSLLWMQLNFLTNFLSVPYATEVGDLTVSFPEIAKSGATTLLDFLQSHPMIAVFGQGFSSLQAERFQRGGDVAVADVVAMLGVPMAALFFTVCADLTTRSIVKFRAPIRNVDRMRYILFGIFSIILLIVSLLHYDVVFKKEVLPILFLSLGLMSRFSQSEHPRMQIAL